MKFTTISTALMLALAIGSPVADAAPRGTGRAANSACAAIGAFYQAVVKAKQSGASKETMDALARVVDDAQAAGEMKEIIEKVYKGTEFDHVPPQTARQIFQASCKLANS